MRYSSAWVPFFACGQAVFSGKLVKDPDQPVQIASHITLPSHHQPQAQVKAAGLAFGFDLLDQILAPDRSNRGPRLALLEVIPSQLANVSLPTPLPAFHHRPDDKVGRSQGVICG